MIMFAHGRSTRDRQRGIALLVVLVALLLVSAITAGMILLTTTETNISANFRDEHLAFFSAKAGIEEARDRMRHGLHRYLRTASLPTTLPGTTGSVLYILNPANGETVAPWKGSTSTSYPDDEICKETSTITCTNNLPNLTSLQYLVRFDYRTDHLCGFRQSSIGSGCALRSNRIMPFPLTPRMAAAASGSQACWNGTNEETTSCSAPDYLPVYALTALAVTPSGSRRMVQAEIAEDRLNFSAPSPLTLDGSGDVFPPQMATILVWTETLTMPAVDPPRQARQFQRSA